jgi:hypothetical protein
VAVIAVAAAIILAMVLIVMVLAELVILIARASFGAVRWHYRRRASPRGRAQAQDLFSR